MSPIKIMDASSMRNYSRANLIGGFCGGSYGKESACNVGDLGSVPGLGRSLQEGNGKLFQYAFLGNSMDRGACWAAVYRVVKELDTSAILNNNNSVS